MRERPHTLNNGRIDLRAVLVALNVVIDQTERYLERHPDDCPCEWCLHLGKKVGDLSNTVRDDVEFIDSAVSRLAEVVRSEADDYTHPEGRYAGTFDECEGVTSGELEPEPAAVVVG